MTTPRSPLPWTVNDYGDIVDAEGKVVVDTAGIYVRGDHRLIVTAVNNYDKMTRALEELARQKTRKEMLAEGLLAENEGIDFEDGYDMMITTARAARAGE